MVFAKCAYCVSSTSATLYCPDVDTSRVTHALEKVLDNLFVKYSLFSAGKLSYPTNKSSSTSFSVCYAFSSFFLLCDTCFDFLNFFSAGC